MSPVDSPPPKPVRRRRWLRRVAIGLGGLLLLLGGFLAWVFLTCFAEPPVLSGEPAVLQEEVTETADGVRHLGPCWFLPSPGQSRLYVEGDPFTLGYANSTLTAEFMEEQERSLIETVRGFYPGTLSFLAISSVVLVNNRNLPSYVDPEYQLEILGLSRGGEDPFPRYGPRYHRILNYHAAHDISHWVWDQPVLGCTAFAASGAATRDGHLLLGRNFDFEAGAHFDENKLITLVRPEQGRAFLSVSWPGMAGAVTGFNEDLLYCSLNGAHSEDLDNIGEPVSLVVRRVLQYAGSVEEAVEIIRGAQVFVSDSYLVADGKTGAAAVVEKSPGRTGVRRLADGLLVQANHFECDEFADDAGNQEYMREGTSLARRARLAELLEQARGELDPERAAAILRDHDAIGGAPLALGHRSAINPMIATHSTIVDLTAGVLWVSRGPHQLGEYHAYTMADFAAPPTRTIPPDPALVDGSYERLCQARRFTRQGEACVEDGEATLARTFFEQALVLNPADPGVLQLLGQVEEALGDPEAAGERYRQALTAKPPFAVQRRALEAALAEAP